MKKLITILTIITLLFITGCDINVNINTGDKDTKQEAEESEDIDKTEDHTGQETPEEDIDETGETDDHAGQGMLEDTSAYDNSEIFAAFEQFLKSPTDDIWDSRILPEYKDDVSIAVSYIGREKTPVLLFSSWGFAHYEGYTHMLMYIDGEVKDMVRGDSIECIYADSGIVVTTYMGGGYGELNRYYEKVEPDGTVIPLGGSAIMDDDEMEESYRDVFEKDFEDTYYLVDQDAEEYTTYDVTREEFENWLEDMTKNEKNELRDFEWTELTDILD